jgi:hypothetical protein
MDQGAILVHTVPKVITGSTATVAPRGIVETEEIVAPRARMANTASMVNAVKKVLQESVVPANPEVPKESRVLPSSAATQLSFRQMTRLR